jgi:hypothetical protein
MHLGVGGVQEVRLAAPLGCGDLQLGHFDLQATDEAHGCGVSRASLVELYVALQRLAELALHR